MMKHGWRGGIWMALWGVCLWAASGGGVPTARPAWVASAPPPQPTAVIALLGAHLDAQGRYHSSLSPYSVVLRWRGIEQREPGGRGADRFLCPQDSRRYLDIYSTRNVRHVTGAALGAALVQTMQQGGGQVRQVGVVEMAGQRTPVWMETDERGVLVVVAFVAAGRAWLVQLVTIPDRVGSDAPLVQQTAATFRFEHVAP